MSKPIAVSPSSKLFKHQQLQRGVFKPKDGLAPEFNNQQDPLIYREHLPAPPAARVSTGFAFMDTSIRLIYDKKDDQKSPVRGIKFNSHGVGFQIEKSNIIGAAPFYEAIILVNHEDRRFSYRMTPGDIAFALACMKHECDIDQDKKLADLYTLFAKKALTDVPLDRKAEHKFNIFNKERSFEFAIAGRVYSVGVPHSSDEIVFSVKGIDERNAAHSRSMTFAEAQFTINKIVADTPRNDMVALAPTIQKMREYMWDWADAAKKRAAGTQDTARTASSRAINLGN